MGNRCLVFQQSSFAIQLPQWSKVLRKFDGSQVFPLAVTYGEVANVHELSLEIDPELGYVLAASAKILKNPIHNINTAAVDGNVVPYVR